MMYKIMSTVKAHLDDDNRIISPTQTLLQDGILQTSNLMPAKIKDKIIDANVVIDKNAIRSNGVCRGDIYIDTKDRLSLFEQRQMINAMSAISAYTKEPTMSPIVIRNAPDVMPEPAIIDDDYIIDRSDSTYVETESAFIGAHVSTAFLNGESAKDTYRNADTIAKTLNKELNHLGLRTVFADMSVCTQKPTYVGRDCYMVLQKTSRFKDESFNNNKLMDAINLGFKSDKLNAGAVTGINIIPVANTKGLIGSISLENVQMAGQRVYDMLNNAQTDLDSILTISSIKNNQLYVNGISKLGELAVDENLPYEMKSPVTTSLFNANIPAYDSSNGYETSTAQDLSSKWNFANALSVNVFGDKSTIDFLHKNIKDIVYGINEACGYADDKPFITGVALGTNISTGNMSAQTLFMSYSPEVIGDIEIDFAKKEAIKNFTDVLNDYPELSDMTVSSNGMQPLLSDTQYASPISSSNTTLTLSSNKHTNETLNTHMLDVNFEDKEAQMSL